jgi:MYXO-CTERM domain-containing protein
VTLGGGDSTGGDTEGDTDGQGEFIEDDGCGCRSGNERGSATVFGLGLLGLLGLRRRRRLVA